MFVFYGIVKIIYDVLLFLKAKGHFVIVKAVGDIVIFFDGITGVAGMVAGYQRQHLFVFRFIGTNLKAQLYIIFRFLKSFP